MFKKNHIFQQKKIQIISRGFNEKSLKKYDFLVGREINCKT
jgi:hypothetical protein